MGSEPASNESSDVTLYVVLPVHNRWHLTAQFLRSLDNQQELPDGTKIELIVADDGSSDETQSALKARSHTTVLTGNGDLWWAGAVQLAFSFLVPLLRDGDWVYLGNNDTVLEPDHLSNLLAKGIANPHSLIGAVSNEIWPSDVVHTVFPGFTIDTQALEVVNTFEAQVGRIDALAGRGLLLPSDAVRAARLTPRILPQHFADLAMTSALGDSGFQLLVESDAVSTQLERAGSSVEFAPRFQELLTRRSQLFLPALVAFWWQRSSPLQRLTLLPRITLRGLRQVRAGNYAFRRPISS
jgi:GT2 family glycosyltransferase